MEAFLAGMIMGTAQRRFSNDSVLQFRSMLSPDPFMGKRGYPLLLAAAPAGLPRLNEVNVDAWMLVFGIALSLVTCVLFGIAPAIQSSLEIVPG